MEQRICKYCGQPFMTSNVKKVYCDRVHTDTCIVCGKEFVIQNRYLGQKDRTRTCSKECASVLRKQTNKIKFGTNTPAENLDVKQKIRNTNMIKYGVEHPSQNKDIKEKTVKTNQDKYGVDYYAQSDIWKAKAVKTNQHKYQSDWPMQNKDIKNKYKDTVKYKYNVSNPMQDENIKKKYSDQYGMATGYAHPFLNPDVIKKSKDTLYKNYHVEHPMQSDIIKNTQKSTNLKKYNHENPMQNEAIKDKMKNTMINRYGSYYMQTEEGKNKLRHSMNIQYNVDYFSQTDQWVYDRMKDQAKFNRFIKFKHNPKQFIESHFNNKPSLQELCNYIGVGTESVGLYLDKYGCRDLVAYVYSYMEKEVYEFLCTILDSSEIIRNTKSIISPYELDIYIPRYNLAIECNPTCTHNSNINTFSSDREPVSPSYHKMKTDMCDSKGIFLFHIFGYEWNYKKDIIQSMISFLLLHITTKYYARKLDIIEVDNADAKAFLNENHRQGYTPCEVQIGLIDKCTKELLSIMTFNKIRYTIGHDKDIDESYYELVRFCNKKYSTVVGGASKLLNYFIHKYPRVNIRSYSDRAHTKGKLYKTLGFSQIRTSYPGYVWVDLHTDKMYHRINAQKHNLKKFLKDESIDLSKTERQIMVEHGYVQVFDSGTICWEYKKY